jgi:hypothetical protein
MQFGPTIRIPESRTTPSNSASSLAPSSPVSEKPAEITTMPRTPAKAHWRVTSMTRD